MSINDIATALTTIVVAVLGYMSARHTITHKRDSELITKRVEERAAEKALVIQLVVASAKFLQVFNATAQINDNKLLTDTIDDIANARANLEAFMAKVTADHVSDE
jgi:uncharacterized membrane protein YqjE